MLEAARRSPLKMPETSSVATSAGRADLKSDAVAACKAAESISPISEEITVANSAVSADGARDLHAGAVRRSCGRDLKIFRRHVQLLLESLCQC